MAVTGDPRSWSMSRGKPTLLNSLAKVPIASWPFVLLPQQYKRPSTVIAIECSQPNDKFTTPLPVKYSIFTGSVIEWNIVLERPNWPEVLYPHAYTSSFSVTAHVCLPPQYTPLIFSPLIFSMVWGEGPPSLLSVLHPNSTALPWIVTTPVCEAALEIWWTSLKKLIITGLSWFSSCPDDFKLLSPQLQTVLSSNKKKELW